MTMPVVVMTMMMTESEAKTFKCSSGQKGDRRETRAISRKREIERSPSRDDDICDDFEFWTIADLELSAFLTFCMRRSAHCVFSITLKWSQSERKRVGTRKVKP